MKRISVSTTTSPAHNSSSARPMWRSKRSTSDAPPAAGAPTLRSTFTDMLCLDRGGERVELVVEALRAFEERRVAAFVVPGNPGAGDGGCSHLRGRGQDQRVIASVRDERRHAHLVQCGLCLVEP